MNRLDSFSLQEKTNFVDCCPTDVFHLDEYTQTVVVKDEASCIFCKECIYTAEDIRFVKYEYK